MVVPRLSKEDLQRILLPCNQTKYEQLPPGKIGPALADQGLFIA